MIPASRSSVKFRSRLAGPILLLLLVIAANYNIVFLGQSLVASANYHPFDYRFTHLRPGIAQSGVPYVNWHDLGVAWWQWEPAGKLFAKEYRAGRIPLWDPEVGGGVDAHVAVTQGQYYPPYVLLLLAGDTPLLRDIYYLLQVFAAGLFCYLLLRRYGCRPVSAVAMGAAYMLGGALTQSVNSIEGQSLAVIPSMVWAVDRVLLFASWRAAGVAALVLAAAALSSFLPIVVSGYLLVGIFVLVHFAWRAMQPEVGQPRIDWRSSAKPVAAVLVSILLIAFLLLPVQLAGRQDEVFSKMYPGVGLQHYTIDRLLTLISPSVSFDVNQTQDANRAQLFHSTSYTSFFYLGLIPVLLAFLGCPKENPLLRKLYFSFLIAAVFLLLKLIGIPPVQWIGYLPVFHSIHFMPYFCGALNFAVAGLAALGIEKLIRERDARALGIGIIASLAVFIAILRFGQTEPINPALQGPLLWSALAREGLEIARLALLAAGFLAILTIRRRNSNGVTTGLLMLALIFLDLASLGARSRFLRSDVWTEPPNYVRYLQRDPAIFRIHATHDLTLTANESQAFGIQVLSSRQSFNSTRYSSILRKYFAAPMIPYPLAVSTLPTARPLLDILNVKYLLLASPTPEVLQQVTAAGFSPKYQDGIFQILQNPTAWDRAYLATSVRVASTPDQALAALADLHPGEVSLERQPPSEFLSDAPPGSVDAIKYDFDKISIHVRAARPSLLVLDENYSPGWRATVQGKPAGIERANYAFQAVEVPSGTSDVEFRYIPAGLSMGLGLTAVGIILASLMIFLPVYLARRRRPAWTKLVQSGVS